MNSSLSLLFFVLIGITFVASLPVMSYHESGFIKASNSSTPPACPNNVTCAGKGDACNGDENKNLNCNNNGTNCCAFGLYCISGTCQTDNMGSSCNKTTDCMLPKNDVGSIGYACQGTPSICTYLYLPGDACTSTNGTSNCITGVTCNTNTSVCQGIAPGAVCSINAQCTFGYQCAGGKCVALTAQGGTCTQTGQCYPGLSCIAGYCKPPNTVPAGTSCVDDSNCVSGTACAFNGTCIDVTTALVPCTSNDNCTKPAFCFCSDVSGNQFCYGNPYIMNPCTSEKASLIACLALNNCSSANDASGSCCYSNCLSDFKKSNSCACSLSNDILGDCFYDQYCGGFPVWAIIVIIVVAIVLVLAIVLLVFFMMRRRRQYDSI